MSFYLKFLLIALSFQVNRMINNKELISHKILEQFSHYNEEKIFNNSFIDFINYKIYHIDKDNIIHKNRKNNNFQLTWKLNGKEVNISCINESCSDFGLSQHKVISFDFDRLLSNNGGIFAYIMIVYGFFSLKRGYIYINLSFIFYGSFSFLLFIREICQLFEITGNLGTLHKCSETIVYLVFYSTLIISILYGFVCHFSKNLKFISLGFIEGIFISKILFYLLVTLKIIINNLLLHYLMLLLFCSFAIMVVFVYLQNKYSKFSIINISLIGGFGIIFGTNIINGGLPFIPYLILLSKYKENELFKKILDKNIAGFYISFLLILLFCGIFWNNSSYNKLKSKKEKSK